jgi:energy-coupling factor transporter ATP-binding protein EcfA2
MKLRQARIQNYRGLRDAELQSCGAFNVLIGRNNSGKSTILAALGRFFDAIGNGIITRLPKISVPNDFTDKKSNHPISITCTFDMDDARNELVAALSKEAPQLKTAIEAVPTKACLRVEVLFDAKQTPFGYVHRIEILESSPEIGKTWLLLEIPREAASELYENAVAVQDAEQGTLSLNRILSSADRSDWNRLRTREMPVRYVLRGAEELPVGLARRLEAAISSSSSFEEFTAQVQAIVSSLQTGLETVLTKQLTGTVKTFSGEQKTVPGYAIFCLELLAKTKLLYLTEARKPIGAQEAQKLLGLKTQRGGDLTLRNIQTTVTDLLGVKIDAFTAETGGRERGAELDVDEFLVELNGSGIRESLRLVLDTTFEKPDILLVEEPEIHLHPGLEIGMMQFLQKLSAQCQVFITTHSTNFLDRGDFQNVFLTSKDRHTTVKLLDVSEIESKIPQELGVRLSSLFMYDRLVFVEGVSDELALRELSNVIQKTLNQRNVGFIPLKGVGNLAHYAAKEVMDFLSKRQVKMWFLIDRDERASAEIVRIRERLGANAVFVPTQSRELENYLLSARPNAAYLSARLGKPVEQSQVQQHLNACVEELKSYVIWKHLAASVKPIYPISERDLKATVGGVAKDFLEQDLKGAAEKIALALEKLDATSSSITKDIASRWTKDRMSLVPGSLLLDLVYQKFGIRFEKVRDTPRLASYFSEAEIEPDLKTFLRQIAND